MAKQGTYFDPTADIVNDLAEAGGDYDNAALKRRGEMMRPILKAAIGKALKFGVKIVAGSDTGMGRTASRGCRAKPPSSWRPGLTPLQALQAATIVNAEMLRLDKRIGAVEPGLEADILVVDGNPARQHQDTARSAAGDQQRANRVGSTVVCEVTGQANRPTRPAGQQESQ